MEAREIRRVRQKRKLLAKRMGKIEEFVRGSVVLMKRPCTYPRCRKCASGERHPTWVLTVSRCGKTHTVYLGKKRLAAAQRMAANYRKLLGLIEEMAAVNRVLLTEGPSRTQGGSNGGKGKPSRPRRHFGIISVSHCQPFCHKLTAPRIDGRP